MTQFRTLDHPIMAMIAWNPDRPAEWINDHILMVHATSNVYVIIGDEGDVVLNTGTAAQGAAIRQKIEALLGRALNVRKLIFTQSHPDHVGGWQAFADSQTEIIAQRMFHQIVGERRMLTPFFGARYANVIAAMLAGMPRNLGLDAGEPEHVSTFADSLEFTFSGRRFRLKSMPSGETLDALAVWLPDEKTVFTGNWAGAIHGALPNFYTARGDRQRSVPGWLGECRDLLAQEPELLITGHEEPIVGAERIRADLTKIADAISHIHDRTVEAMNAGVDIATIQASTELPAGVTIREGRCPPHWIARAVYEEYAGWFHQDRTSELYTTPQSAIWPELVEAMGGPEKVAERALELLSQGETGKALHFAEMAAAGKPASKKILEMQIAVFEALADQTEGKIFDLLGWLEGRIMAAKGALAEQQ
jgi:alkyl sulfatase BDS1-like metallo-beta-lactamase superfamily hydrolase